LKFSLGGEIWKIFLAKASKAGPCPFHISGVCMQNFSSLSSRLREKRKVMDGCIPDTKIYRKFVKVINKICCWLMECSLFFNKQKMYVYTIHIDLWTRWQFMSNLGAPLCFKFFIPPEWSEENFRNFAQGWGVTSLVPLSPNCPWTPVKLEA